MNFFTYTYKRNESLLHVEDSLLLIIDIQERFRPAMNEMGQLISKNGLLLQAADRLKVPVLVTEQYPKGLGKTVQELASVLPSNTPVLPKLSLSALGDEAIYRALKQADQRQIIVTGIEAHVCVLQTVMDLLANFEGWVYVVQDAISSRKPSDHSSALERMRAAGAHVISAEMAVFEWLKNAGDQAFKDIQNLLI